MLVLVEYQALFEFVLLFIVKTFDKMSYEDLFDIKVPLSSSESFFDDLNTIPAKPGVCLLSAKGDKPVILLYGANLRAIVKRRLDGPEPEVLSRKADLRPLIASVYCKMCYSRFQTQLDYFHYAKAIYPSSWQKLFPRLNCWFIYLDQSAPVAVFKVTDDFDRKGHKYWGPFATKVNADRMLEAVTVIHKLCRCTKNLQDAPNSVPCSYSQMSLCSMVCDGSTSFVEYRQIIDRAVDFLDNPVEIAIARYTNEIKQLSARLEFEKAEKTMRLIDECKKVSGKAYRWVGPMADFKIVCFQSGPKVPVEGKKTGEPGIIPFIISTNGVKEMPVVPLSGVEECCHDILSNIQNEISKGCDLIDQYLLAWVCNLLNKSDKQKGLFIRLSDQDSACDMAEKVSDYFARK